MGDSIFMVPMVRCWLNHPTTCWVDEVFSVSTWKHVTRPASQTEADIPIWNLNLHYVGWINIFYYQSPHLDVFWQLRTRTSFIFNREKPLALGYPNGFPLVYPEMVFIRVSSILIGENAHCLGPTWSNQPPLSASALQASAKVLEASSRATRSRCGSILPDSARRGGVVPD